MTLFSGFTVPFASFIGILFEASNPNAKLERNTQGTLGGCITVFSKALPFLQSSLMIASLVSINRSHIGGSGGTTCEGNGHARAERKTR